MKTLEEPATSVCMECRSRNIINDPESGEIVCRGCGLVISESNISVGPEWRAFTQTERDTRARTGPPSSFLIYDKGLSTVIGPVYSDAYGRRIPQENKLQFFRLRKWNIRSRVHYSTDRNLSQAMSDLDILAGKLHLPFNVKENAAVIYRKALKKGLIRGRSILSMVAACLYAACRETQTPRTLVEIERCSPRDKKEISRDYRMLLKELNLRMPVQKAKYVLPKIASKVEVSEKIQRKAIEILGEAERLKITVGKDPMSMAAAALYLTCKMNKNSITQKDIAEAADVTEVTIRNRYKDLKKALNLDI